MKSIWVWIMAALVAVILGLLGIVFGWWGGDGGPGDPSPSPSASSSLPPDTGFVERPVTVGDHVPSASALSADVLAAADTGWVLAIYDTATTPGGGDGTRVLYLIDPAGTRYEVANLGSYDSLDLLAWDPDREVALFSAEQTSIFTVDFATAAASPLATLCTEGTGYFRAADLPGDAWLMRGGCAGDPIDGRYDDNGAELDPEGVIRGDYGSGIYDVGDVQVYFGFETPPEDQFIAHYPDATTAQLDVPVDGGCYPLGKGNGDTLAVVCFDIDGQVIYELPANGDPAQIVVHADEMDAFLSGLPDGESVVDYCGVDGYSVVGFQGDEDVLSYLRAGGLSRIDPMGTSFEKCQGSVGDTLLGSGDGPLWTFGMSSFDLVELLPGGGGVVGAGNTHSIIHP